MPGDGYRRGAHPVLELKYHFVWTTKYSYRVLRGDGGLRLRELIRQICAEKGIAVVKGNVRPNHIHLLVNAPAYLSPAKMAQYLIPIREKSTATVYASTERLVQSKIKRVKRKLV